MTDDMLEQHANVLVNLGPSDDAALLRAKIQSASLLSDMQSFKVMIVTTHTANLDERSDYNCYCVCILGRQPRMCARGLRSLVFAT